MSTGRALDAEEWVLTTVEGRALLEEVGSIRAPGPTVVARWRRNLPREVVEAALRLSLARRRGLAKFSRAEQMWLVPVGLEQATSEVVAGYKSRRFAGERVVDLCSGIGGDALALGAGSLVSCVDADEGMCRRLRWNAGVYGVADRIAVTCGEAREFPISPEALVHVDPDRRAHGTKRARSVQDYEPDLPFLIALASKMRGGAIKLGPASDFEPHFGALPVEIELISTAGECKEATVWFGSLASCRRRATTLPSGATWMDRDGGWRGSVRCDELSRWVFDPDPALIRSGLLDSFAEAHGLGRVAASVDYLTGPERVDSPFLAAFAVRDVLPLDVKRLRRTLAEQGIGALEIKVRGLDRRPETLRSQLAPAGPHSATLLVVGGAGPARVILAARPALSGVE